MKKLFLFLMFLPALAFAQGQPQQIFIDPGETGRVGGYNPTNVTCRVTDPVIDKYCTCRLEYVNLDTYILEKTYVFESGSDKTRQIWRGNGQKTCEDLMNGGHSACRSK